METRCYIAEHFPHDCKLRKAMKNDVFWDMAPCTSCVNRRFGGTYRLHLQGRKIPERGSRVSRWLQTAHAGSSLTDFSTLKLKASRSSETSVHTRSTRRQIPENGILHSHRRENLKSYIRKATLNNICCWSIQDMMHYMENVISAHNVVCWLCHHISMVL
jgi:hypothetical protein